MLLMLVDDDPKIHKVAERVFKKFTKENVRTDHVNLKSIDTAENLQKEILALSEDERKKVIVLLDLKFKNDTEAGKTALTKIKNSRTKLVKNIPVVMYSSSKNKDEIASCYQLKANSYFWKGNGASIPIRFERMLSYWISGSCLSGVTPAELMS